MKTYFELTRTNKELIDKSDEITMYKTEIKDKKYIDAEELFDIISSLIDSYEYLEQENKDLKEELSELHDRYVRHDYSDPDACERDYL